jgi:hypothetical protein
MTVLVTVSDTDGSPRTDLVKENFTVTLFGVGDAGVVPSSFDILPVPGLPAGVYWFGGTPAGEASWNNTTYYIIVNVTKHTPTQGFTGFTMASAQVSFKAP